MRHVYIMSNCSRQSYQYNIEKKSNQRLHVDIANEGYLNKVQPLKEIRAVNVIYMDACSVQCKCGYHVKVEVWCKS